MKISKAVERVTQAQMEGKLLEASVKTITEWLLGGEFLEFHDEILALIKKEDWKELNDAFFQQIEFGTGGMRGTMGLGSARINTRTIGQATEALAQYIETFGDDAKSNGVVVCHEVRNHSRAFAEYITQVLCAHGIRVFLFEDFRSTPELSFATRHLGAQAGIMISASHNPSTDNGYKVYWSMGEQVVAPHDKEIMGRVPNVKSIPTITLDEAQQKGLFTYIGEEIDTVYIDAVLAVSLQKEFRDLSIVYTPLHGTGQTSTLKALKADGFSIVEVEEQMKPDGNFSSIEGGKPNPEDPKVFQLALQKAKDVGADVVMASDPDADRLGVAVLDQKGEYQFLTGNQIGVLILDYLLFKRKASGELVSSDVVVKTVVTTDMVYDLCQHYGVRCVGDLLVGFKYIANVMKNLKEDETFLMGVEESLGYLMGDYAYDKDAAGGAIILAELMAELKAKDENVLKYLENLYREHGYYVETLEGTYFEGADGKQAMETMMEELRKTSPSKLGDEKVYRVIDRQLGDILDPGTDAVIDHTDADQGNVLIYELSSDGRTKATIRPSGTEPKVKYYIACKGEFEKKEECDARAEKIGKALMELAESFAS